MAEQAAKKPRKEMKVLNKSRAYTRGVAASSEASELCTHEIKTTQEKRERGAKRARMVGAGEKNCDGNERCEKRSLMGKYK